MNSLRTSIGFGYETKPWIPVVDTVRSIILIVFTRDWFSLVFTKWFSLLLPWVSPHYSASYSSSREVL